MGEERPEEVFFLNGEAVAIAGRECQRLIDRIREEGFLSVREGCGNGFCGSCVVLVDGDPQPTCLLPVGRVTGRRITTLEGLGSHGVLTPLQQAFIDESAMQCGYCTAGMLLSLTALQERTPHASPQEIREVLSGHLCRCTGYGAPLRAALRVLGGEGP